jgi:phenylacetate-CoA ligase
MDWNRGTVYRAAEWAGTALGERTAQMSGSHFDYTQSQKLQNRIVFFLQRYRDWPVGALTEQLMDHYFHELQRFRPTSIWGYASGLNAFAAHIERRHPGARLDFVKAIITSSETLPPEQRACIDRVFGAGTVHDNYGSREMYIGSECSAHDGYHLHGEVVYLEVVRPDGSPCDAGERGRILVTDLSNHAFPFIRYEIGDVGVMAPASRCACGVTLPRLQSVEGRIADLVVLRDRVLTPPNFTLLFSDLQGIEAYQVRQDSLDRLDLYVVPGPGYGPKVTQYVLHAVRQLAGEGVEAVIHEVPRIEVPESGKRRYIVSKVSAAHLRAGQTQPS